MNIMQLAMDTGINKRHYEFMIRSLRACGLWKGSAEKRRYHPQDPRRALESGLEG